MKMYKIVILSAMKEEVGSVLENIELENTMKFGDLIIYEGIWLGSNNNNKRIKIFLAWSGWGKVSAARAITRIICLSSLKESDLVIFTGVAGACSNDLKQWDVVISSEVIQYDMDARPLFNRFEIPALKKDKLVPKKNILYEIYKSLLNAKEKGILDEFGDINLGLIGTGDKFISNTKQLEEIKILLPDIKAVEMEGSSVAQVCEQENIPWIILRTISDNANESAADNFSDFLKKYKYNSYKLINEILSKI